jgi:hypothetical protein
MSLDKRIAKGEEKRKPYFDSRRFDSTCRNHGTCPWCHGNRTHKNKKQEISCEQQEKEVTSDHDEYNPNGTQEEN